MKAMLLAAGRGSRLRPLTDTIPKPLLRVQEQTLIEHNIARLVAAGIREIVINVAYLATQIMQYLGDGKRFGVNIQYSLETEGCLGTGGGVLQALPLLGEDWFWVISADIWSDYVLTQPTLTDDLAAHLLMVPNPAYHPMGDYGISPDSKLNFMNPKMTYANFGVLHPRLFAGCKPGVFALGDVFRAAIAQHAVSGVVYTGRWFNVGTAAELNLLRATIIQTL